MTDSPEYRYFEDEKKESLSNRVFYCLAIILVIFYIFLVVSNHLFYTKYTYITVVGTSMQPTLNKDPSYTLIDDNRMDNIQDGVYLEKTKDIDYGDIIVLNTVDNPTENSTTLIKRAMAFGGDYVSIARVKDKGLNTYRFLRVKKNTNRVEILYEDYIKSYQLWDGMSFVEMNGVVYQREFYDNYNGPTYNPMNFTVNGTEIKFFQVPEDNIFFLGDNRSGSSDSRSSFRTFNKSRVVGKVVKIVKNGTKYKGNKSWWWNRFVGLLSICWDEILSIFA